MSSKRQIGGESLNLSFAKSRPHNKWEWFSSCVNERLINFRKVGPTFEFIQMQPISVLSIFSIHAPSWLSCVLFEFLYSFEPWLWYFDQCWNCLLWLGDLQTQQNLNLAKSPIVWDFPGIWKPRLNSLITFARNPHVADPRGGGYFLIWAI